VIVVVPIILFIVSIVLIDIRISTS
jgi:hypothetical protein